MKAYWAPFFLLALVSCSSDGGSSPEQAAAAGTIDSRFVGLWDQTGAVGDTYGKSVYYYFIREDGASFDYDYYGDSFDSQGNCYVKTDNHETYRREDGNYRVSFEPGDRPGMSLLVSLDIVDNELQMTALETLDSPNIVEGQVFELGKKLMGVSITDIENQLCSDDELDTGE